MSDDEIRDFWKRSIYQQYADLHPRDRHRARWRASSDTLMLLARIVDDGTAWFSPDLSGAESVTIVGRPVDIDESAEGVVLYVPEAAR